MTGNTWHISRIYWAAVHPAKYAGTIRAPRQTFPAAQSRLPSLEGSGEPAGGKACESPRRTGTCPVRWGPALPAKEAADQSVSGGLGTGLLPAEADHAGAVQSHHQDGNEHQLEDDAGNGVHQRLGQEDLPG